MTLFIWLGIIFCVTQSAMFSGLNLAFFSISILQLEIESKNNNRHAVKIAKLRADSNLLLTTILWGNVGINVLLTLLSNSVMVGFAAFIFSSFVITFLGEIIPQAYFSRHAFKTAALLAPVLKMYQTLLYPVAKPSALFLDWWLGPEAVQYFQEKDLREMLILHMDSEDTDIEQVEGKGALNFLALDDLSIVEEGESIAPESILQLPFQEKTPVFPAFELSQEDAFLQRVFASGKKWMILVDESSEPHLILNSNAFLRSLWKGQSPNPLDFCHKPLIVRDPSTPLGDALARLKFQPKRLGDDVIEQDIILFWGHQKLIITGADVLGRLLRGVTQKEKPVF